MIVAQMSGVLSVKTTMKMKVVRNFVAKEVLGFVGLK